MPVEDAIRPEWADVSCLEAGSALYGASQFVTYAHRMGEDAVSGETPALWPLLYRCWPLLYRHWPLLRAHNEGSPSSCARPRAERH